MHIRPTLTVTNSSSVVLNHPTTSPTSKPLQIFLNIQKEGDGEESEWQIEVSLNKEKKSIVKLHLGSFDVGKVGDYNELFCPNNCALVNLSEEFGLKNQNLIIFSSYANGILRITSDYFSFDPPTPPESPPPESPESKRIKREE